MANSMFRRSRSSTFLLLVFFAIFIFGSSAEFGIPKPKIADEEIKYDGSQQQQEAGIMTEEDAHDIASVIQSAKADPETMQLVAKLKGEMRSELDQLRTLSQEEILGGLKATMDELKMVDYLFQDKKRALEEMEKDGMIDKQHIKKYRKNPELLEQDTRQGVYFQFVAYAVVGGFMD
jgi:hypothetical protein